MTPIDRLQTAAGRFSRAILCTGLTTGQFARGACLTLSRVAAVRGGAEPTPEELAACALVCDVSLDWLKTGNGVGPAVRPTA